MCNMNVAIFILLLSKTGYNMVRFSRRICFSSLSRFKSLLGSYIASTYEPTLLPILLPMYMYLQVLYFDGYLVSFLRRDVLGNNG